MNRLNAFAGRCVRNGVDIFPRPYFGEKYRGKKANEKRCERRGDPWKVLKTCFHQDMMSLLLSDDE